MEIDYQARIPNNVDLGANTTLQRALEHWQPRFLDWWREMGPSDFLTSEPTAASASATASAIRPGSRCRASTAPACAGSS